MKPASLPPIIQGGMGVAVSGWRLARAVSRRGQLGVVSGTCLDTVLVRRLQDGDRDGALRRAMDAFPMPGVAARALTRYFRPPGRAPDEPYQLLPLYRQSASKEREALTMLAAFSEVYLAKEGHQGLVGINLLTKVQRPNIATLYGAMLAGVDYVLMGAGVDGFVIEGPTAGGHNAPPRGTPQFNARGEPVYGSRDEVDVDRIRELGLPFWLAGGMGHPEHLRRARAAGAAGIQVGTLFAYCEESGVTASLKASVLASAARGEVDVITDPAASPTGYPFKVVEWPGNTSVDELRERICDLGYLRVAYARPDGKIGYRCASEPVDAYVAKGGDVNDTVGRRCLCNALLANVGLAQLRANGEHESPLLTSGDDLKTIAGFLNGRSQYFADDVIDYLLAEPATAAAERPVSSPVDDRPA